MAVNDIVSTTYGAGGKDSSKPNNNIVEQQVITAETPTEQTVEIRNGAGVAQTTYTRTCDRAGENDTTIRSQARNALATNRTYINKATPSAAETTAQVKALSRQMNGIIRIILDDLEGTD